MWFPLFLFPCCALVVQGALTKSEYAIIKADLEKEIAKIGTSKQADIVSTILESMIKDDDSKAKDDELYRLLLENTSHHYQGENSHKDTTASLQKDIEKEIEVEKRDANKELLDAVLKYAEEAKEREEKKEIVEALIRNRALIENKDVKKKLEEKEVGKATVVKDEELEKFVKKELERRLEVDVAKIKAVVAKDTTKNTVPSKDDVTTGSDIDDSKGTTEELENFIKKELQNKLKVDVKNNDATQESETQKAVTTETLENIIKKELEKRLAASADEKSERAKKELVAKEVVQTTADEEKKDDVVQTEKKETIDDNETEQMLISLINEEVRKRLPVKKGATQEVFHDEKKVEKEEGKEKIANKKEDDALKRVLTSQDKGELCYDERSHCLELRHMGFCESHRGDMWEKCRRTCGFCKVCQGDIWKTTTCQRIQAIGYCTEPHYEATLKKNCHNTCGYCRLPSPPACTKDELGCCWDNSTFVRDGCPACADSPVLSSIVCKRFINACHNPGEPGEWMKRHCPETCRLCRVHEEHHIVIPTTPPCMDKSHACACTDCDEFPNFAKRYCCKTCRECKKPKILKKVIT